jgi:hypothetical protein
MPRRTQRIVRRQRIGSTMVAFVRRQRGEAGYICNGMLGAASGAGEHRYGQRAKAVIDNEEWEGPAFGTCMNAATVCRRFQTSSREEVVSFRAHQAIAPIADGEIRQKVLAWAATPNENGRRPIILEIEASVSDVPERCGSLPSVRKVLT